MREIMKEKIWNIVVAAIVLACLVFASKYDNPLLWRTLITLVIAAAAWEAIRSPRIEKILIAAGCFVVGLMVYFPRLDTIPLVFLSSALVIAGNFANSLKKPR